MVWSQSQKQNFHCVGIRRELEFKNFSSVEYEMIYGESESLQARKYSADKTTTAGYKYK